jgi:Subtilase family/Abnormal spindle-like microcephaly-assoc'd, ASPM-SPD-2-Hydin
MSTLRRAPIGWRLPRRVRAAAMLVLACAGVGLTQGDLGAQNVSPKLTTVLADLARVVPQRGGGVQPAAAAQATPLAAATLPRSVRDAMRGRRLRIDAADAVQVYILMAVTDANVRALTDAGVTIEIRDARDRRVQARIPLTGLEAVAELPFVDFIRLPSYAVRLTGSFTTEGDAILSADVARQQYSLDGTGIKVGVISDGLKGIFATGCTTCSGVPGGPIGSGDLPDATGTRNSSGVLTASTGGIAGRSFQSNSDLEGLPSGPCGFAGAGAEGTALLEIVHDIAPGAQLSFANADTDLAFNQAVNFLAASNDVVMDDLGFYGEPTDGTSPVSANTAAALNNVSNRIRAYVTATGNSADEHYLGTYVDSGLDGTTVSGIAGPGHLHLFQQDTGTTDVLGLGPKAYNVISLPANGEVVIFLTWNDPLGHSANNYDLYLARESGGGVVARSVDLQTGSQDPLEAIDYVNTGASGLFHIVVQNVRDQAQARQLNLFSFEPECATDGPRLLVPGRHERHNYNTAAMSVPAQSDAGGSPVSVISVGAICSGSTAAMNVFAGSVSPDESCTDRNHATAEFFTSRGPTLDGRVKPDVAAVDGVTVSGAGSFENPFFGTSAATPHVAGEAALLLQAAPCLVSGATGAADPNVARGALRNLVLSGADPMTDAAPDNLFGFGRVNVLTSVGRTLPLFKGSTTLVIGGNTASGAAVSPSQLGFTDPDQCPVTRLSWTGGCGSSPGAALACPFGTTHVSVSASNNGLSFSTATGVDVTVTNFTLAASPDTATVSAGQSAAYTITLAADGGAFPGGVTLACTTPPPGATCSFSPAVVAPGSGSAQSILTISTNLAGAVSSAPAGNAGPTFGTGWMATGAGVALAVVLFVAWHPDRRGRWVTVLATGAVVVVLALAYSACGGGNSGATTPPPSSSSPAVSLAPAALTFASQTTGTSSAGQAVTLTNTGSAALTISSIAASGDFAQTNTCGSSVAAGANCTITVTFTPTATGSRTGALTIADNASGSPHTVGLSGTGAAAPSTPPGTYQVGITGSSGSLVHAGAVTLVVK